MNNSTLSTPLPNSALAFKMEPSAGSHIDRCFDEAVGVVRMTGIVVHFTFNEVFCGVRPCDVCATDDAQLGVKQIFVRNYHREATSKSSHKICYANP